MEGVCIVGTVCCRDEAQAKMILLKEKADKDLQQHNAEMKELVRIIDHDRKLRDFMYLKGKEREEDKQLVKWRERKGTEHPTISSSSSDVHVLCQYHQDVTECLFLMFTCL